MKRGQDEILLLDRGEGKSGFIEKEVAATEVRMRVNRSEMTRYLINHVKGAI